MSDRPPPPPPARSRGAALFLAFLGTGMGHVYLGRTRRALAWAGGGYAAILVVLVALREVSSTAMIVVLLGGIVIWIASMVDVAMVAPSQRPPRSLHVVLLAIGLFLGSRGYALVARARVLEAFKIPAGSMMPSIRVGDHVFVDKVVFRGRAPHRGEIAVFPFPEHPDQDFVKRVIALPGDKLEVRGGHPILNGWEVPSCFVGTWSYTYDPHEGRHEGDLYVEFLEESAYLVFFNRTGGMSAEYQGPFHVADDEVWFLGDNRNNSHDSRMWFGGQGGGVKRDALIGRPRLLWLSVTERVDWSRMGMDVSGDPYPPSPELREGLEKCLRQRPPPARTTPPPPSH